jgi:Flp pilus assembly protein, protease CpaA
MGVFVWAAVGVFAVAALRDLVWRCIDDVLVAALLVLWGLSAFTTGLTGGQALGHVAVGAAAFLVMWGAFAMGWMGGGDVKLAAAVFLWTGPGNAHAAVILIALAGLGLAVCCILASLFLRLPLPHPVTAAVGTLAKERGVPYGIALSAGGIFAALASTAPGG